MQNIILLLLLLLLIAKNVIPQLSPCPGIFEYRSDGYRNFGLIHINDIETDSSLLVRVKLTARVLISDGNDERLKGTIVFPVSKQNTYQEIKLWKILRLKLVFPLQDDFPIITEIKFNNDVICRGKDLRMSNVTRITLTKQINTTDNCDPETSTYTCVDLTPDVIQEAPTFSIPAPSFPIPSPSFRIPAPSLPIPSPSFPEPAPSLPIGPPLLAITTPPTTTVLVTTTTEIPFLKRISPEDWELKETCGQTGPTIGTRIINGEFVNPGEWPWIVAVYVNRPRSLDFICGGTLISSRAVLTAAHCISYQDNTYAANEIVVVAGRHNIDKWDEGVVKTVLKYELHSDYDNEWGYYDADIALLIVKDRFSFTDHLRPACLWTGDSDMSRFVGLSGVVVGWGKDEREKPFTKTPRKLFERIVSKDTCAKANIDYQRRASSRMFCAGEQSDRGPCRGDSGSGLVLDIGGKWYLRGIVSNGIDDNRGACDTTQYSMYTDVSRFLLWINKIMASNKVL